ncbi:MAG: hypothetical protein VKL59_10075 [Nostocaceae cyanobacterium]|nr:hypothetical protein [Nostocaceae cyanobacterium]
MSRLNIADISFFEAELNNPNLVLGGAVTVGSSSPYGAWVRSYDTSNSSGYYAGYSVDRNTGVASYAVGGYVGGSLASAIAAGVTDRNGSVTVFANSFTTS